MKNFAQSANDLSYIIESLEFIANKNSLNFDSEEKILKSLTDTITLVKNIDIMFLFTEIWNKTSYPNRVQQAEQLLNKKFKPLLNWKVGDNDIAQLTNILKNDCLVFYERRALIGKTLTAGGYNNLIRLYKHIGLQLLRLKVDYGRLMDKIKLKAIEEDDDEKLKIGQKEDDYKFRLHPDKKLHFANELRRFFREGYFIPSDKTVNYTEEDILINFQQCIDVQLLPVNFSGIESETENNVPETIAVLNADFENFLLHSNKNLLAKKIRDTFNVEKGKSISLLLYALQTNNPPLITTGHRQLKSIYRALGSFMNRDIGTYQSILHKYLESKDKPDLESIRLKLNHILDELDKD